MNVKPELTDIYPLNLACDIFDSKQEALKIYIPGLFQAVASLSCREQGILFHRYSDLMTLKTCGELYGIGANRIRQIQVMALRKLRHPSKNRTFKAVSIAEYFEQIKKYELLENDYEFLKLKMAEQGVNVQTDGRLQTLIKDLDISVRSHNCLARSGVKTLKDICEMTENDLLKVRNMGNRSALEVIDYLASLGLSLKTTQKAGDNA